MMLIQFNGEIDDTDIQPLLAELKQKGHKAISIKINRWIGTLPDGVTPFDRGGRVDIEIPDDIILPSKKIGISFLEAEIKTNNKVKNKT